MDICLFYRHLAGCVGVEGGGWINKKLSHFIQEFEVKFSRHSGSRHICADMGYRNKSWTCFYHERPLDSGLCHYDMVALFSPHAETVKFKELQKRFVMDRNDFTVIHSLYCKGKIFFCDRGSRFP